MLLPILGLMIGSLGFAILAALVLRFVPGPGLGLTTFIAFILFALVGSGAYGDIYSFLFAKPDHVLQTRSSVYIFLVGIPIFGSLSGWCGASAVALIQKKVQGRAASEKLRAGRNG